MTDGLRARARGWFAHPRAPALALAAALCLSLTTLGLGKLVDDRWHDVLLGDDPAFDAVRVPPWDVFRFFDGDAARTGWLRERGLVPWWTDTQATLSFLRPLSSLTHALDRWLGGAPLVAHAQSIAWYVALVAAAVGAYRALLGPGVALGLAAWMYAVDFTHGMPVGWLANRNAVVSATFGLLAVRAHAASRGWAPGPWVAAALVALALAGGESGMATLAFLAAHALLLDDRGWRARAGALAPSLGVALAWLAVYRALGYGAHHSGVYLDPVESPALAAVSVPRGALLLVSGCLGAPGPDPTTVLPEAARAPYVLGSAAMVALALFALWPTLRTDARARYLLVGGSLAVLPATLMVLGSMRMLLLPSFGLLGAVALGLASWLDAPSRHLRSAWLAWSFGGHVVLAPALFVATTRSMAVFDALLGKLAEATAIAPGVERLVYVNAPEPSFLAHAQLFPTGRPRPPRQLGLANGLRAITVHRDDDRSLTVTQQGSFIGGGTDSMLRLRPMRVGERVQLGGVSVDVVETDARGMPTVARFSFAVPLEDARLGFVSWDGARVARFVLPAPGASVHLDAMPLLR